MLSIVYWNGKIPQSNEGGQRSNHVITSMFVNITTPVLISLSLLVGTFFGQIIIGILGDRYGRKRMYGVELIILTLATVLMALSSKGALASTNGLVWIVAWRFVMGIGIGGDYPLSAVITAE